MVNPAEKIATIYKLSKQAYANYKWQIIALTVLSFIAGLSEGIGVNALIPLFSLIVNKGSRGDDLISKTIEKFFELFHISFNIKFLLLFIVFLFVIKSVIRVVSEYVKIRITSDYEENTRRKLFSKILATNWSHLIKQKSGYLENIVVVDVAYSADLLRHISAVLMILVSLSMYALIAVNISFGISIVCGILGIILFAVLRPMFKKIKYLSYQVAKLNKQSSHHMNQSIAGIKTIKTMVVSDGVVKLGDEQFAKLKKLSVKISLLKNLTLSFIQPLSLIFIVGVFLVSYKSPNFNIASLVAIVYLIQKMFNYIEQLQKGLHSINELIPRLGAVLSYEKETEKNQEIDQGRLDFKFEKSLKFDHVSFSYSNNKEVLNDLNFEIQRGETVGLIGPSGVGKTTLVDLILRLFNPSTGTIILDNKNISDIKLNQWRKEIGYVSQDIFLINDTIKNNIKFFDDDISDEDIIQAAKMANIFDFIQSCPDQFMTPVGERGLLLSAGQRQRIAIARILARKPKILILDEATSALDNESEQQIQNVIRNLKRSVTVIIIAHRLSTVMECDNLMILKDGKIFEQDEPAKLLSNKDSYFYKTYNLKH